MKLPLHRFAACFTGLWAGVLLCIGTIAAPAAFAVLASSDAGRVAGRMLNIEANVSLGAALLLFFIERRQANHAQRAINANVLLLLGTLFCTVAGHFAVQPMMAAAKAGQGAYSFALLHAVSGGLFVLKGLLVLALAWRLGSGES
jgi:hypothetical protein